MSLKSLETMETLAFFVEIIQKEGRRFNVSINPSVASQLTAATASDLSFDVAHNRCSYLYRCGTINLCFAKDCFSKFLSSYINVGQLMHKWGSSPNFTACSISKGPALDYIALLLALSEKGLLFPWLVKNIKVVTHYGAWRNTANIMLDVLREGHLRSLPCSLPFGTIEVFQGDPFKELTEKIRDPISNSDVVIMTKAFNLLPDAYDQKAVFKSIQLFIDALKPGAVLFCIDTKTSITEITQVLSTFPGSYLFEPTLMSTMINLELEEVKNVLNCLPVISGRGNFFVWQKSSLPTFGMDKFMQSVNLPNGKSFSSDRSKLLSEEAISKHNAVGTTASVNSHQSKCSDEQWADNFSDCSQGSSLSLPSRLSENKLQTNNFIKAKRDNCKTFSYETSISQCTQTENEDLKETESNEVAQLNNRIALLTKELSDILETNISNGCLNDHGSRNSEVACNSLNDYCHSHPMNMHECSRFQSCVQNCDMFNDSQNHHMCQHSRLTPNQYGSNISLNESAGKCRCGSQQLKLIPADNSHSSPQLVIPLNNLSGDVLTQIVLLLNQSKQDI